MEAARPSGTPASGTPASGTLFGLDPAETALLGDLLAEAVASHGLDGRRILDVLAAGRPLREALALPPGIDAVLYARAHTWFAAGRLDRAESLFRALCTLDGRDADPWVGYGVCLRMRGARAEAGLAFATAAALRPDWAIPHFHAAGLAAAGEQWEATAAHLAAFQARIRPDLPGSMLVEAARMASALADRADRGRAAT